MTDVQVAAAVNDLCGESPLWSEKTGLLSWVDISGNLLRTLAPDSGHVESFTPPVPISALAIAEDEMLVVAGARGVCILDRNFSVQLVADCHEGEALAINDAIVDPAGRLLAGSTFFDGSVGGFPLGKLYSIGREGRVSVVDDGFLLANGMGFSPDQRTFYCTDSLARVIYAYDYNPQSGTARNRRALVRVPLIEGLPDGLTIDQEGFIWSAQWFGSCVCRYDPEGRLERRICIPAQQVSSIAFGGCDYTTIFITTAAQPDALAFAPPGYSATGDGGQLFQLRTEAQGKPEYVCRIKGMHLERSSCV